MALEYFPCYHSYKKKIAKLSDQEVGRLFRALLAYSETGEEQELAGREAVAYDFIADDIDRAKDNYTERCKKNSENALKKYDRMQSHANGCESCQSKSKNKDKSKNENKDDKRKGRSAPFIPPTVEEIEAYCRERKNNVNPEKFFDYFTASGWIDSTGKPVKKWKQKVITWENNQNDKPSGQRKETSGESTPNLADVERMQRMLEKYK